MRAAIKYIVGTTWQPLLKKYLAKTRHYSYEHIHLQVPSTVFHPGFFFSTHLLLDQIKKLSLENKKLLEPGAGSGLISIYAAQHGAIVTATDINPTAVKYLYHNCETNNVRATILESDLFERVPEQVFDIIAINPPYYKRDPQSPADYAWFCGENGEYFAKLFGALKNYIHPETIVLMILCDGCDIDMVKALASEQNFVMKIVYTRQNVLEKNFIYSIEKKQ